MIQEIEISKLRLHPKNVRRDYGDLTDLTNSVRAQGILMNLTVVKDPIDENYYLVVDGNCRLKAAREAGLEKAPCAVVEMTEQEQLRTMLLANMQRKDLSIIDEARGVQMCLNMGDTEEGIAAYTGLSRKTIQTRRAIASIDVSGVEDDKLQNVTIEEFLKIATLRTEEHRAEAFKQTGTNNFNFTVKSLKEAENKEERKAEIIKRLERVFEARPCSKTESFADSASGWLITKEEEIEQIEKEEGASRDSDYRWEDSYGGIWLYRLKGEEDATAEDTATETTAGKSEEYEEKLRQAKLRTELRTRLKELRREYADEKLLHYFDDTTEKKLGKLLAWMTNLLIWDYEFDQYEIAELLGKEDDEDFDVDEEAPEMLRWQNGKVLWMIYRTLEGGFPIEWDGSYKQDVDYARLYAFLEDFGYGVSDEERKVLDGTHELFQREAQ